MRPAPAKTGAWTEEEDVLLLKYQAVHGNKWSQISQHIPGRNGQQVAQRWRHKVNPNILKDKWSLEEDRLLTNLVEELGVGKWASVARHLPGRTDQQCMGRWRRHLDPNIRKDAWTTEEDARLQALYLEHGPSWSFIAKSISDRTPQQCRGRWCILASSRIKAPAQAAPEDTQTDPNANGRKGRDAASAPGVEAARQGRAQPQGCASIAMRVETCTELPAMPASASMLRPAGGDLPPEARMTRARARVTAAGSSETDTPGATGVSRRERRPCVLQDPGSAEALAAAERVKAPSQDGVNLEAGAGPSSAGIPRGRLLLGTRLLSFRRCSRSTQRKPRTRLAALAMPAGGTPPSAGHAVEADPLEAACATAVPLNLCNAVEQCGDGEPPQLHQGAAERYTAACNGKDSSCQGVDCGDAVGLATSLPCEAGKDVAATAAAGTCERPTVSTSSRGGLDSLQLPAGRTEAAPDDSLLHMSTRITRSGRCYPLGATPSVAAAKPSCPVQLSQGVASTKTSTGNPATAANGQDGCADGPNQEFAAFVKPHTAGTGQYTGGDASAPQLPDAMAGEAGGAAPDYDPFAAQAPALDAVIPQGVDELQQATPGASVNTSLGLADGLFGTAEASPAGEQPLDWQEIIGSPPTSSFLAFVQAGLLQTPSAAHSLSPGPDMLCAPVPPGMAKVTPGFSNEWSDVPALSWTELQACHGGFGIVSRQPTASAHGTPDNSRPAPRPARENSQVGVTPRRDMYVRQAWDAVGAGSASALAQYTSGCTLRQGAVEPVGEGEGQGDTRSLPPSPSVKVQGCNHPGGGSRGRGSDEAGHGDGDGRYATGETATPDRPPQSRAAVASATNAAGGRTVPDFCSPAKKQQAVLGRLPVASLERAELSRHQPPSSNQGCGLAANSSLAANLQKLKSAAWAPNGMPLPAISSAPLCPPPVVGGASSSHPFNIKAPSFARPPFNEGQLPLPPALTSALMPVMAPQGQQLLNANTMASLYRPPGSSYPQLSALAAPGASADFAQYMPSTGRFGGLMAPVGAVGLAANAPTGAFPRLALPKPPVAGAGTIRSLFPVLSLNGYRTDKENVMR